MIESLKGQLALVTGGAGDIGFAIAGALAERGAKVVLADVDIERASDLASSMRAKDRHVTAEPVDLADPTDSRGLIHRVVADHGAIDVLVNAAAVSHRGRIDEIPDEAWDRLVAVNLSSVFWTCRAAIPHMVEAGGGVIINIGSIAAIRGLPGSPLYAATKGGVVALTRALAIDHARDGIRLHTVNPPAVDTRLYRRMFASGADPAAARRAYEETQGAGRVLTTEEIAALVVFLAEAEGPVFSPEPLVW